MGRWSFILTYVGCRIRAIRVFKHHEPPCNVYSWFVGAVVIEWKIIIYSKHFNEKTGSSAFQRYTFQQFTICFRNFYSAGLSIYLFICFVCFILCSWNCAYGLNYVHSSTSKVSEIPHRHTYSTQSNNARTQWLLVMKNVMYLFEGVFKDSPSKTVWIQCFDCCDAIFVS